MKRLSTIFILCVSLCSSIQPALAEPVKVMSYNILNPEHLSYGNYQDLPYSVISAEYRLDKIAKIINSSVGELKNANIQDAAIICGDFNLPPEHPYLQVIKDIAHDAFEGIPYPTVNIESYLRRVDYIFHSKKYTSTPLPAREIQKTTTLPSLEHPSDHLPVVANIYLNSNHE